MHRCEIKDVSRLSEAPCCSTLKFGGGAKILTAIRQGVDMRLLFRKHRNETFQRIRRIMWPSRRAFNAALARIQPCRNIGPSSCGVEAASRGRHKCCLIDSVNSTIAYYWTSGSILNCRNSLRGSGGGGGGAAAATATAVSRELWPSGGTPSPSCPGSKYPVREIPHFVKAR